MGKVTLFAIQLEKQDAVFFAGDWINGQVVVQLTGPMKMRGIHLGFKGEAYVYWTETKSERGPNNETKHVTETFTAREPYFNQSVVLFGKAQGRWTGGNQVLQPGRYMYPFQFRLPYNLPSSYEHDGGIGHIRYQLHANIDMPWQFDYKTKRPFTVVARVDLNSMPNSLAPQEGSDDKMICCLCCASGPISAHLKLDRSGYVPGEYIVMSGEIENRSTRRVKHIKFKLEVRTMFHARGKTKTMWKTISEIGRKGLAANDRDSFTGLSLLIPPLPPSYLGGCRIIDLTYVLKLSLSPSGPATALNVPLEVIIGTIPFQNVNLAFVQNPFQPILYDQNAWINAPPRLPSAPPAGALPPPAYEECFWGRHAIRDEGDDDHTSGPKEWAPAYPYYSWGNNPSAPPMPSGPAQPLEGGAPPKPIGEPLYYPPAGSSQAPPAGSAHLPPGGATFPSSGGFPHAPPDGNTFVSPGGAAYPLPAGAMPHIEPPPPYSPPGGYSQPPAGYAAPPSGNQQLMYNVRQPPIGAMSGAYPGEKA